jgi:hypothetical protein
MSLFYKKLNAGVAMYGRGLRALETEIKAIGDGYLSTVSHCWIFPAHKEADVIAFCNKHYYHKSQSALSVSGRAAASARALAVALTSTPIRKKKAQPVLSKRAALTRVSNQVSNQVKASEQVKLIEPKTLIQQHKILAGAAKTGRVELAFTPVRPLNLVRCPGCYRALTNAHNPRVEPCDCKQDENCMLPFGTQMRCSGCEESRRTPEQLTAYRAAQIDWTNEVFMVKFDRLAANTPSGGWVGFDAHSPFPAAQNRQRMMVRERFLGGDSGGVHLYFSAQDAIAAGADAKFARAIFV